MIYQPTPDGLPPSHESNCAPTLASGSYSLKFAEISEHGGHPCVYIASDRQCRDSTSRSGGCLQYEGGARRVRIPHRNVAFSVCGSETLAYNKFMRWDRKDGNDAVPFWVFQAKCLETWSEREESRRRFAGTPAKHDPWSFPFGVLCACCDEDGPHLELFRDGAFHVAEDGFIVAGIMGPFSDLLGMFTHPEYAERDGRVDIFRVTASGTSRVTGHVKHIGGWDTDRFQRAVDMNRERIGRLFPKCMGYMDSVPKKAFLPTKANLAAMRARDQLAM